MRFKKVFEGGQWNDFAGVAEGSFEVLSVMEGSTEVLDWKLNKGLMKNNLQINCKLAVQYWLGIIMRAVHGSEHEAPCVWYTKAENGGMQGERSRSQGDALEASLKQHTD